MDKVKKSVSLDEDVLEFIQKLADKDRSNVSQVINKHFAKLLEDSKKE